MLIEMGVNELRGLESRGETKSLFFATLRVDSFSSNGKLPHIEENRHGHLSAGSHASNSSSNIEEHESNNHFVVWLEMGNWRMGLNFLRVWFIRVRFLILYRAPV